MSKAELVKRLKQVRACYGMILNPLECAAGEQAVTDAITPINGVAVRIRSTGEVLTEPAPKRHGDILNRMRRLGLPTSSDKVECGFTMAAHAHQFFSREEAYQIASEAGQIVNKPQIIGKLFSEDVW